MNLEISELIGSQVMRYIESKGWKIGAYERKELTITIIKFQKTVK